VVLGCAPTVRESAQKSFSLFRLNFSAFVCSLSRYEKAVDHAAKLDEAASPPPERRVTIFVSLDPPSVRFRSQALPSTKTL
jgi:hypothetical protein